VLGHSNFYRYPSSAVWLVGGMQWRRGIGQEECEEVDGWGGFLFEV